MNTKKKFNLLSEVDIKQSPWNEVAEATGRARCRICGEKIEKGLLVIKFTASFTDGGSHNEWTAVDCQVHATCAPNFIPEKKRDREKLAEAKKVVLLQKEATVYNGGIAFRVIASGVEEEGFGFEVQGPDGDIVTANIGWPTIDEALKLGISAAEKISPDWYAKLRNDERDIAERELARLRRTKNNITNDRISIQSRMEKISEWLVSDEFEAGSAGFDILNQAFEHLANAKAEMVVAEGTLRMGIAELEK